jgi:FkbM family methyltransferase
MRATARFLKNLADRSVRRLGYHIERIVDLRDARIDVFDVLLRYLHSTSRGDFFFVQIGANDGVHDDPIRSYIQKFHWRGLLVEPLPHVFAKLLENYREEPQLIFENAAIAERDGSIVLFAPDSGATYLATFDKALLQKHIGYRTPVVELRVPSLTLRSLLAKHTINSISLLQIDAEGFDSQIIKMLEGTGIWPRIIRFEHHLLSQSERRECFACLADHGYGLHRDDIDAIAYRPSADDAPPPGPTS